jgi:23S rRNA pseudouridine955/2504/2580 synthase
MFLHAWRLAFVHPLQGDRLKLEAPLPLELENFISDLK